MNQKCPGNANAFHLMFRLQYSENSSDRLFIHPNNVKPEQIQKFLGLAKKWIRSVQEMLTLFILCSGFRTHLTDSLFIPNNVKPEQILINSSICWIVRSFSSKSIRRIASKCSLVFDFFRQPYRGSSLLSMPRLNFAACLFTVLYTKGTPQQLSVPCSHGFPWLSYLSFADTSWLISLLFWAFLDLSPHPKIWAL